MSRTKRYLQRKTIERLPTPALDLIGKAVLQAVDKAVDDRWDRALQLAADAEGETPDERVRAISKRFRRELTVFGAATGAVAAAPGLGTGAATATLMADLGWFAMRATDLIMAIGAAHGHTGSTREERRAWVLSVLAFGEHAADEFSALLEGIDASMIVGGERVSARLAGLVGGDAATLDALRRVNASLAAKVVAKYGSRRTLLAIGKVLPFGIGAAFGGTANYALTRLVGSQANRFFTGYRGLLLPPPPPSPALQQPPPPPTAAIPGSLGGASPASPPPPPAPGSERLPNPPASLSDDDRRRSIPTEGRPT